MGPPKSDVSLGLDILSSLACCNNTLLNAYLFYFCVKRQWGSWLIRQRKSEREVSLPSICSVPKRLQQKLHQTEARDLKSSLTVQQGDRGPSTWASICCLPASALAGRWIRRRETESSASTLCCGIFWSKYTPRDNSAWINSYQKQNDHPCSRSWGNVPGVLAQAGSRKSRESERGDRDLPLAW